MLAYYIPFILIWLTALCSFVFKRDSPAFFFSVFFIVYCFVVLRYQTGYDWVSYNSLYDLIKSFDQFRFSDALLLSIVSSKELLYVYLNLLLKLVTNNYVVVQIASGSVLFFGVLKYLKHSTQQYAFVFAVTFSWLMFSLYFSVVRQALSVGLFFLFLIAQEKENKKLSFFLLVLAVGMQYSSIMYFMLYYIARKKVICKFRHGIWGLSLAFLVLSVLGIDLATMTLGHLPTFGISQLEDKMHWYLEERSHVVDLPGLVFVGSYTIVIGFLLLKAKNYIYESKASYIAYNFALIFLPIQAFFLNYSVFRNRILYVAMVITLVIVANYLSRMKLSTRFISFSLAMLLSFAYYTLYLSSFSGGPFVPYQNVVGHYLFEYISDGEDRLDKYTLQHK